MLFNALLTCKFLCLDPRNFIAGFSRKKVTIVGKSKVSANSTLSWRIILVRSGTSFAIIMPLFAVDHYYSPLPLSNHIPNTLDQEHILNTLLTSF